MKKATFNDLPREVHREITTHCSTADLVNLALVSRAFNPIASAELYRCYDIIFPDNDDISFHSTGDALAGGLDTMVSSERTYAKYLKQINMDTLSGAESAYKNYGYETSCGKFLSTLVALTLKKAVALEKFNWNIRVELSRSVFAALRNLPNLQHLKIRLQNGPSIDVATAPFIDTAYSSLAPGNFLPIKVGPNTFIPASIGNPGLLALFDGGKFPTFAGFNSLKTLAVYDIDCYSYPCEIATAVSSCAHTLKKLKLSVSEKLARKARAPVPSESDDSDDDEEDPVFAAAPPPVPPQGAVPLGGIPGGTAPPPPVVGTTTESDARVRKERRLQEAILEIVFGEFLEGKVQVRKKKTLGDEKGKDTGAGEANSTEKPDVEQAIQPVATEEPKETLEGTTPEEAKEDDANSHEEEPPSAASTGDLAVTAVGETDGPGLFDSGPKSHKQATNSDQEDKKPWDEIDIDHPDVESVADGDETDEPTADAPKGANDNDEVVGKELVANGHVTGDILGKGKAKEHGVNGELETAAPPESDSQGGTNKNGPSKSLEPSSEPVTLSSSSPLKQDSESAKKEQFQAEAQAVRAYIRSTRKIPLETLALYLIPIRPGVLSRTVDLKTLRRLTLLNVGPQAGFWNLMATVKASSAIALSKIFTDDVSTEFLKFVQKLDKNTLSELFLLRRKGTVEPLVPEDAQVVIPGIKDIKKMAIQRHIGSLKRLMVKNTIDYYWDLDGDAIKLITSKGKKLEELACSITVFNCHRFIQLMTGLINLRALYFTAFRNDDQCQWAMQEVRQFIADTLAHHPKMKLEYIGLVSDLEKLERHEPKKKQEEGGEANANAAGSKTAGSLQVDEEDSEEGASADEDDDALLVDTVDVKFYNAFNVRIFKKEVRAGKL